MQNSKNFKKVISILSALVMMLSFVLPNASYALADTAAKTFDLVEVTDFHGTLLNSYNEQVGAVLAKSIKNLKASNPDRTLIMGGGDLYQGSALSNILRGKPVADMFKNIGMEVSAVGNHEFDWGLDTVKNNYDAYPFVCANLYDKTTGKRVFDPYKIITKDGVKIAVVGAITEDAPNIISAQFIKNYEFKSIVTEVNAAAADAKAEGAQVVLAVIHAGDNLDNKTGEIFDVANKLTGVDAVIGGHSHSIVQSTVGNMPVVVGCSNGKGYIDLKMTVNADGTKTFTNATSSYVNIDKAKTYYNVKDGSSSAVDQDVYKIVTDAQTQVGPLLSQKLGTAAIKLDRSQPTQPYGESLVGNWCTDVTKNAVNADFGFQNNGGLRTDIPAGDVTMSTMYSFMPFDNEIVTFKMTAPQIKTLLEQAIGTYPNPADTTKTLGGKGIQVAGLKFTYNPNNAFGQKVINITKADGTKLNLSDTTTKYTVATNDFMGGGGDGFGMFADKAVASTMTHTGILVRDALANDVQTKGTITASYENRMVADTTAVGGPSVEILATSDVHGEVYPSDYFSGAVTKDGLARVSTYVYQQRQVNPNLLLVDNGDTMQGTPLVSYYNKVTNVEYPMAKAMGLMKYDSWTLGNHEFNFGLDTLNRVIKDMTTEGIPVLSANTYKADGTNFVKPYIIKTVPTSDGDVKVGILGLTTKCVPSWENPGNYAGLSFNDLVDEAKKQIPVMKAAGADVIVVAMHSGEESASDTIPENEVKAVAQGVDGIDAIIAGHAHSKIAQDKFTNPSGKTVIVTEPGKSAAYVSKINLGLSKTTDGKWAVSSQTSTIVPMDDTIPADTKITTALQSYQDTTVNYIGTKIGKSSAEFSGAGQTVKETALMDLINKVQMQASGAQLSIAAPLSASAYIPSGDVTIKDISSVYVFENYLYKINMTGAQIKKWMELSVKYYKQVSSPTDAIAKDPVLNTPDYNLDMLYGAQYTIDLTQPAGSRIKNLMYNGKYVKDTDVFTVAVNNYRYNGGGGFMAAAGLNPGHEAASYDSAKSLGDDGQIRNLMIKYFQSNGTITPTVDNYMTISTTPVKDNAPSSGKPYKLTKKSFEAKGFLKASASIDSMFNYTGTPTVVFELLRKDPITNEVTPVSIVTSKRPLVGSDEVGAGFNVSDDPNSYVVRTFVVDDLNSDLNSIGTSLADTIELSAK